jgi:UDP-3-O-[3-hydroxymyristoyl] glucosamine N-acyltransferase
MFGGQVGVTGHIRIGDDVKIGAQSGIGKTIMNGETVMGSPAFELGIFQRSYVGIRKLPDLINRINDLERELKKLKNPTE